MDKSIYNSFKDPKLVRSLLLKVDELAAKYKHTIRLMEVCGTHTVSIAKSGLRSVLPSNIKLLSGPGCPVCVTANVDIDTMIALTRLEGSIVATFGDMLRVPGSSTSLAGRKAAGAQVDVVYSPLDALKLARENPDLEVIFLAVGFETTAPLIAATIERAIDLQIFNLSFYAVHKRVPPALKALVDDASISLDALILPGHVSTVLGLEPYEFLSRDYNVGGAVTGFDPADILQGIICLIEMLIDGKASIKNAYTRAVMPTGNEAATAAIKRVFDITDATWRGLGNIAASGYVINEAHAQFDAARRFGTQINVEPTKENTACKCGDVLRGAITPNDCPLFGHKCSPQNPIGPCMVSSEGSCAAFYRYQVKD